jgi:putative transposase
MRTPAGSVILWVTSAGTTLPRSMLGVSLSFWSRMQVKLLDRKKWNTRLELANAIFEHLEIWHSRRRRHSQLGWLTPIEFERNRIIPVA